ncbi:MAG TPA: M28 family metallopeptidase [Gemmatimonadales bacterium]|nr:M28 family metallopeptidase [Gemmatimonadales bacterium]
MAAVTVRSAPAALLLFATALGAQGTPAKPISGFGAAAAQRQFQLEERLNALLSRDSTAAYFKELTTQPHPAGSERNHQLALWMAERWRGFGLEDVRLRRYDVLLPWPERVSVTLLTPTRFEATLKEDCYPEDPDACVGSELTYFGMSASGDVTGELVYASSGNPADYDWLESQGIDLHGKIAIVRYSNPYSYRGFKALTAERRGLKALLIYSDPQEDGYRRGLTFPTGPWGPESHIQRGAITYDFMVPGDPLTPGWASVEGARRIPVADAASVPKIIAVPMSANDAAPLLKALTGSVAPPTWQGALPFTYRVGAGPAMVRVTVKMDDRTRPIWVVEGRIGGSEHPEQMVVLGNHRDAWVFGAVDPSSGTATEMELARALGVLTRDGQRPNRSIVFASWDAEEWHLTGSTEWGEQFAQQLGAGAVAYLNVDGSVSGPDFEVSAVASLDPLIVETARDVTDPSGGSLFDAWCRHAGSRQPVENRLGSGSDYTVFLNRLGLPIVDMAFEGPYGVYHSQYDNAYWMTHYGDPGFRYMTTMADVWGRMALRLANAQVLPFDFSRYADVVGGFLNALDSVPGVREHLDLSAARAAHQRWTIASAGLDSAMRRVLESQDKQGRDRLNRALRGVEQAWLLPQGIPGRPWFRHALYAPKYTYAAMELPGVREAVDRGDWSTAARELVRLTERISAVADAVQTAAAYSR